MKTTWFRVFVGSVAAIILLGLAVLEVVGQRIRFDQPSSVSSTLADTADDREQDFLVTPGDRFTLERGPSAKLSARPH